MRLTLGAEGGVAKLVTKPMQAITRPSGDASGSNRTDVGRPMCEV